MMPGRKRTFAISLIALLTAFSVTAMLWNARRVNGTTSKPDHRKAASASGKSVAQLDPPPVQVLVTKLVPTPGRYVYRYTVVNGSAFPITDLLIGNDYVNDVQELSYAPMGWNGVSVPPSGYRSPPGWKFQNVPMQDDSVGHIKWDIARRGEEILGGTSAGGFEVTLDEVDPAYEGGH
jgi:hypothetical protein